MFVCVCLPEENCHVFRSDRTEHLVYRIDYHHHIYLRAFRLIAKLVEFGEPDGMMDYYASAMV